jgi:uncharacterized protein YdaU (DUF1376 family)
MSKDPAVLFYTSDFLSGTGFMTFEQRGQYITLLCQQHQLGHIPTEHMLNICKTHDSPVLKKFIKDESGLWYNVRMEKEIIKRTKYSESRRSNKLNGKNKETYDVSYDKHMLLHMENGNENENINEIKDLIKSKKRKKKEFSPPSLDEVKKYFKLSGYKEEAATKMFNYYSVANWVDSKGKKILSWKQKAITVWFKEENKIVDNVQRPTKLA